MMKAKRIVSLILVCLTVVSLLAGCKQEITTAVVQPTAPSQPLANDSGSDDSTGPAGNSGSTVTIGQLKNKYCEPDAGKLLPLYNLDATEPLVISLKYTPSNYRDVFSIHTDEKCLEASKITLSIIPSGFSSAGPKTYEVKPMMAPLASENTDSLWGGVSNYYIKFYYDITAETETKLEEPVIVAFSIQSPVAIPNTGYTIENGCFTLTWTPVEGATSYRIYQRQVFHLLEDANIAPSGKEEAYGIEFPMLEAEVSADTLSYNDWMNDGQGGKFPQTAQGIVTNSYQNQGVNGEYYVTAVIDGQESLFSMGVNTANLELPEKIENKSSFSFQTFDTPADLPRTAAVQYVDGSVKSHRVYWEALEGKSFKYTVENTDLVGYAFVRQDGELVQPEAQKPDSNSGFVAPENQTQQNAPGDVPTVNNGKDTSGEGTGTLMDQQIENTRDVLEEANQETVVVPDAIQVTASSAAEEYLALSLVAGRTEISLAAFPQLQNWATLTDVLTEVVYQNPMILGVRTYAYNYSTMVLTVTYDYSKAEMEQRQNEILAEGRRIINEIITADMDDGAKRRAIYEYLQANTAYDDAACEDAMGNNFQSVSDSYRDSFSTYGILVRKVGVCQSYAYAFDYLCQLAGVNCIVVTGYMMGYLPHAWNKVEIDGQWLAIDVTNNEKNLGIADFMYENPDAVAQALGYIEDDLYYTVDDNVYHATSMEQSKYQDCLIESAAELKEYIRENTWSGATVELLAVYEGFDANDVIAALAMTGARELSDSKVICGYVWFEVSCPDGEFLETIYDSQGRVDKEIYILEGQVVFVTDYTYHADGTLAQQYTQHSDGLADLCIYDENQRVIQQIVYENGVETYRDSNTFNDRGLLAQQRSDYPDGTYSICTYTYNEDCSYDRIETVHSDGSTESEVFIHLPDGGLQTIKTWPDGSVYRTTWNADGEVIESVCLN